MWQEFKKFIAKGNVFDLAVGIVIGAAFTSVVQSFVRDILMPPIGLLTGDVDFSELYINLSGEEYASLAEATEAGAATINYGVFLNNVISFLSWPSRSSCCSGPTTGSAKRRNPHPRLQRTRSAPTAASRSRSARRAAPTAPPR